MVGMGFVVTLVSVLSLASPAGLEQQGFARIHGRVLEENHPIRRMVEIRLESLTSGVIDRAYTLSSDEFEFRAVPVDLADQYVLVIEEDGFRTVREPVQMGRDPFGAGVYVGGGMIVLYLNPIPTEEDFTEEDAPVVGLQQLTAEISPEARDAYEAALEAKEEGEADVAVSELERAVRLAPDFYDALNELGVAYLNVSRFGDAGPVLERARALNRNDPLPVTNLGILHFQEAQALEETAPLGAAASYVLASEYLGEAMRLNPGSGRVAYYLGSALYKAGEYELAEEALLVAMGNDPAWDSARLTLINVYVRQQRHEDALEQIRLYLEAHPDTPERQSMEQARTAIQEALERGR